MENLDIGQAWVGRGHGDAPPILCAIGAIDDVETGEGGRERIISVQITPPLDARKAGWKIVSHMPFTEKAFTASGFELAPNPVTFDGRFREGYAHWREKYDRGDAGAFSVPVAEAYFGVMAAEAKREASEE